MSNQCSIISKQHVSDALLLDLCLCSQACEVKKICHLILCGGILFKLTVLSIFQHDSKENAKEGGDKNRSSFHTNTVVKCVRGSSIELDNTFHISMKGLNHAEKFWWETYLILIHYT